MAHVVKLGALTDELVTLLTSTSAKVNNFCFVSPLNLSMRGDPGTDTHGRKNLQDSAPIENLHCGHYGIATILERTNLTSQADSMGWRRSSESTMKTLWLMP